MLIKVFASGTNVQRLAKGSGRADGVVYTAYSQLEQTEENIVKRKFYMSDVAHLKDEVEQFDEVVQPSWTKIWAKPNSNKAFISKLFISLAGEDTLRAELNLSNLAGELIECFMVLVSANNNEMKQIKKIAETALPNYHIKLLNGDYTSNKKAQEDTTREINEARIAGKDGVIIISNQMGSRSYSISEIQAAVIAYDRGSVDATQQKVSRCLTPGLTYSKEVKEFGYIVDLSFDPNRSENIEKLLIEEAVMVSKSEKIDYAKALTFVLSSINCFNVNGFGIAVPVNPEDMFALISNNDNLLQVADVTANASEALDIVDMLAGINTDGRKGNDKKLAINSAKNKVTEGENSSNHSNNKETKALEKIINDAVRTLNRSATSVAYLAGAGETYSECISIIKQNNKKATEFGELFGVDPSVVEVVLDRNLLNEALLDVIVQNSKYSIDSPFV